MSNPRWYLVEAVDFVRHLVPFLAPHYYPAMTGSVLFKGHSDNDLDIIIYPHTTMHVNLIEVRRLLRKAGLFRRVDRATVVEHWRKAGSDDDKWVEVWDYLGKRVDIFMLK